MIQLLKGLHVTQTEKKHLELFLKSGYTSAKVNRKFYEIMKCTPDLKQPEYSGEYTVRITNVSLSELLD